MCLEKSGMRRRTGKRPCYFPSHKREEGNSFKCLLFTIWRRRDKGGKVKEKKKKRGIPRSCGYRSEKKKRELEKWKERRGHFCK